MRFGNVKTTRSRKSGGYIWKSGQAKKYAFQEFFGGGVIWRNPDLTGFSLMTASLSMLRVCHIGS